MLAIIRNLVREPNYQSVCTVECPGCGMIREIMYGGWTAIACVHCDKVLYRNRACKRSDTTTGGK